MNAALLLRHPGAQPDRFNPASFDRMIERIAAERGATLAGFQAHRVDSNAATFDRLVAGLRSARDTRSARFDSWGASAGMFQSRELEHRYAEVLREPTPMPNGLTLFPTDSSVPPGARSHVVSRLYAEGEVKVHRAGEPVGRVGLSAAEESFPVRHYVTSFGYDLFDSLSAGFASFALGAELLRTARDLTNDFANRMTWYGSTEHKINGVLNYPWLDKLVASVGFYNGSGATDDEILAALNQALNHPHETSLATMMPNTLVVSPRVRNYLMQKKLTDGSGVSLGKWWLDNVGSGKGITSIEEAWELQGVGPSGMDGVLFYRRDRLGIANVIVSPFGTLPSETHGFEALTYCYMSHGGIIMRNAGNNVLMWVQASA